MITASLSFSSYLFNSGAPRENSAVKQGNGYPLDGAPCNRDGAGIGQMHEESGLTPSGSVTDSLLHRAQLGDREALERIAILFSPGIFKKAKRRGLSADDLVQEVFRRVTKAIGGFRRDSPGQSFRKWLNVIAKNVAKDQIRTRNKGPGPLSFDPPAPTDDEEDDEFVSPYPELVRRAVEMVCAQVEKKTCQCFKRSKFDGQSYEEIGADLGMKPHTVRQAVSRFNQRFQAQFSELLGPDDPFRKHL